MKAYLIPFLFVISSCEFSESAETRTEQNFVQADSSEIIEPVQSDTIHWFDDIASYPFDDQNNLDYFMNQFDKADSSKFVLRENAHVVGVFDTLTTVYWIKCQIEYSDNELMPAPMLETVLLKDATFSLKNGVSVGDKAEKVFNTFGIDKNGRTGYSQLLIESIEGGACYLYLIFSEGAVKEIVFFPYTG